MKSGELTGLSLVVEDNREQRAATVLANVSYVISARFELTPKADDSNNPGKHLDTFNRHARKGQCFHQPCLGTCEFPARFELSSPTPHSGPRGTGTPTSASARRAISASCSTTSIMPAISHRCSSSPRLTVA